MVDLADSKNDGAVLDADSDALIRFSIFTYLRKGASQHDETFCF